MPRRKKRDRRLLFDKDANVDHEQSILTKLKQHCGGNFISNIGWYGDLFDFDAIDASIVRIMKSRKVVPHQQLMLECVEQLGWMFKPNYKIIKKRIEDLIAREYLERDTQSPNIFRYLA